MNIKLQLFARPGIVTISITVNGEETQLTKSSEALTWEENVDYASPPYTIADGKVVWNDNTILQYNSVDVLPTDAIISGGIYTTRVETSTSETWVLNDTLTDVSRLYYVFNSTVSQEAVCSSKWFTTNFTSNDKSYYFIGTDMSGPPTRGATDYADLVYETGAWKNSVYKTITLSNPASGDLLTWLEANGVKKEATVNYIISETELTTIADSIRTKTSSSDKLTPSAMAEKIKTIPIITDVSDAATLTAKLTENNMGNFYRYTGTATSDYATGAIYQVTQV